jgi:hypothetical protein
VPVLCSSSSSFLWLQDYPVSSHGMPHDGVDLSWPFVQRTLKPFGIYPIHVYVHCHSMQCMLNVEL